MRTFEIILCIFLAIRISLIPFQRKRWDNWITIAVLGAVLLQPGVEGYRWQLIPLYALTLGFLIHALWSRSRPKESARPRSLWWKTTGMLVIFGSTLLPPNLLPIPQTPAPTGPYPVGTFSIMLTDDNRTEQYSDDPSEPRQIMVQFWYPAQMTPKMKIAPWMDNVDIIGPAIAGYLGLPDFFLNHIEYSQSHAYTNAVLASNKDDFPLLVFSHGWNGFRAQNSYQMEELASYGYVIAAPDHAYGSVVSVYPDGQVALNNPEALPHNQGLSAGEYQTIANLLVDQWAGDLSFILDRLAIDYSGILLGMFSGRLDLDNIGALGHSTGGGAIVEFCARDARCAAGMGMDTYMKPVSEAVISEGLEQPFLYMFSEEWPEADNLLLFDELYDNSSSSRYMITIEGTAHYDFTDLPAFSPLAPALGLKGPLNGDRVLEIINRYSLAFFDQYLRGNNSVLLAGSSEKYPEVEFGIKW